MAVTFLGFKSDRNFRGSSEGQGREKKTSSSHDLKCILNLVNTSLGRKPCQIVGFVSYKRCLAIFA